MCLISFICKEWLDNWLVCCILLCTGNLVLLRWKFCSVLLQWWKFCICFIVEFIDRWHPCELYHKWQMRWTRSFGCQHTLCSTLLQLFHRFSLWEYRRRKWLSLLGHCNENVSQERGRLLSVYVTVFYTLFNVANLNNWTAYIDSLLTF